MKDFDYALNECKQAGDKSLVRELYIAAMEKGGGNTYIKKAIESNENIEIIRAMIEYRFTHIDPRQYNNSHYDREELVKIAEEKGMLSDLVESLGVNFPTHNTSICNLPQIFVYELAKKLGTEKTVRNVYLQAIEQGEETGQFVYAHNLAVLMGENKTAKRIRPFVDIYAKANPQFNLKIIELGEELEY